MGSASVSTTTWRCRSCSTSHCGTGTTPEDAIRTFFEGEARPWDEARSRFETLTETHILYWTRHEHDQSVIVISCFEREEE